MQDIVLILTNSIGGLYNFRQEVIKSLIEANYHVVISAPRNKKIQCFLEMGCEYIETPFKIKGTNPWQDIKLLFRYKKIIKRLKPLAVLTYTIKPNIYGGIACKWCKVFQIANITGLGTAVEKEGWMQKVTIFLYRIGMSKTHLIFFQNQANLNFFQDKGILKGKKMLIPGSGVNIQHHSFQQYPTDNIIRFLFIGRIQKEKGIDQYLEAAEILRKRFPFLEFHVVGSCYGHYAQRVDEYNQKGVIIYHGQQIDVRPYYKMANCTISPSYYPEGMSNVLLESCAAGRPIITTNRPGCGEVVDDGVNGFLVRQEDTTDLVHQIEKFIHLSYEEKRQMGLNARKKVEQEFNREIVVNAYLKAVDDVRYHNA